MADPPPAGAVAKETSQAIVVVSGQTGTFTSTAVVAVSDVRAAGFDLGEIKKLVTQTKAIGVIMPPPDIRAIVDKTASFVAKHGPEFEKRILTNERSNAKFNFLVPIDPYHAYYQMRIKHFKDESGEGPAKDATGLASTGGVPAADANKPAVQVIPHALAKLEKPEDELYTAHIPEGLSLLELDIIKLAAQFVARNGQTFLTGLSSREHTNPQFSFLRPTHSLFGLFKTLCDAYSRVLMPPKGTKDKLQKDTLDGAAVLERATRRLEYEKVREKELQEQADEAERERLAYQAVDWHEFVVVETLEFFDDEDEELPLPYSLKDIVNMNKAREYQEAEERRASEAKKTAAEKAAQGVAMTEEERALVAQAAAVALKPTGEIEDAEMEVEDMETEPLPATGVGKAAPPPSEDEDEGPIRVVKDYVRPQARALMYQGAAYDPTKFAVSPITGELVAIADMAEHMRISLIDPRWKEQREAMLSKLRDTTKASDDEIGRNLMGLAKTRPDIFGSTEEEVTQVVAESIREKLTSGTHRPVAWDGVTQRGPELNAQLSNIQQNRQQLGMPTHPGVQLLPPGVGPAMPPPLGMPMPPRPPPLGGQPAPPGTHPLPPPPPLGAVAAARAAQQAAQQAAAAAVAAAGGPPGVTLPPPSGPPGPPGGMMMPPPPRPPGPPGMPPPPPGTGFPPPPLGMMRPPGMPPLPREAPPPPPEEQPDAKRPRLDDVFVLKPEDDFLLEHSGEGVVRVQCPKVDCNSKLHGQRLEVQVASLKETVAEFKKRLEDVVGLATNKMRLQRDGVGFLQDTFSLAHYNVGPDAVLTLSTKERAKGKKG